PRRARRTSSARPRRRGTRAIGTGVSRIARSTRSTERNGEHRLLQIGAKRAGWPKSPRALTGRLRQAQTLRAHSGLRGSSAARAVEMRAKTRTQIRFGPLALGRLTRCNRSLSTCPRARSSNIQLRPILRFIIGLVFATAALASPGFAHAQPTDDSLRLYAVDIWQDPPQSWGPGRGVCLGKGLIITAAHVVTP